jgi:hypothetical protein
LSSFTAPSGVHPDTRGWAALDAELATSLVPLQAEPSGPQVHGLLRSRFAFSGDVDANVEGGEQDLLGFNLDIARVSVSGTAAEDFTYLVSFEGGEELGRDTTTADGVGLYDAYARMAFSEWFSLTMGQFCMRFIDSACMDERNLLFLDRSFIGEALDNRDVGAELRFENGAFHVWLTAQNGFDGAAEDLMLAARAAVDLIGQPNCKQEGALGCGPGSSLSVGLGWLDDQSMDEGTVIGADVLFRTGALSAIVEVTDFDEEMQPGREIDLSTGTLIPGFVGGDSAETPWNLTLGWLFNDQWEVAARYQDIDDEAGTAVISAAVNRYVAGHDVKWTLQLDSHDSDDDALEGETLAVGLTVGF